MDGIYELNHISSRGEEHLQNICRTADVPHTILCMNNSFRIFTTFVITYKIKLITNSHQEIVTECNTDYQLVLIPEISSQCPSHETRKILPGRAVVSCQEYKKIPYRYGKKSLPLIP